MKNTFLLLLFIFMHFIGISLTLIMLYASPDSISHFFESSLFYLGTSIMVFSFFYNVSFKHEVNNILRYCYIFLGLIFIPNGILLLLIILYASPDISQVITSETIFIYIISSIIVFIGYIFMFKHNAKEIINA